MMDYRPWGSVDWALSLSKDKQWHFVGVIGTEERSTCARKLLRSIININSETIALITDKESTKYSAQNQELINNQLNDFYSEGGKAEIVDEFFIGDPLFKINEFCQKAVEKGSSVILDITSFPKKFFFPILKVLVTNESINNLILIYTSPQNYSDEPLYEDIDDWDYLPGFLGTMEEPKTWIVSVGFLFESLRKYLGDNPEQERVKILIPYPAPLKILKRTWESIYYLQEDQENRFENYRVDTLDISSAFNRIVSLTNNSRQTVAFAPFGPKPTSAAMCLYAISKESSVYYPQPTVYHPNYSIGIRNSNPLEAVNAYWIKHEGENLYQLK